MRGLFLRNYLSQIARDKLPDTGSEYEGSVSTNDAMKYSAIDHCQVWLDSTVTASLTSAAHESLCVPCDPSISALVAL